MGGGTGDRTEGDTGDGTDPGCRVRPVLAPPRPGAVARDRDGFGRPVLDLGAAEEDRFHPRQPHDYGRYDPVFPWLRKDFYMPVPAGKPPHVALYELLRPSGQGEPELLYDSGQGSVKLSELVETMTMDQVLAALQILQAQEQTAALHRVANRLKAISEMFATALRDGLG
jgi:hypothetical protein